jgi:TPR repeat protein
MYNKFIRTMVGVFMKQNCKFGGWVALVLLVISGCVFPSGSSESLSLQQLKGKAQLGDVESQYQLGVHYTVRNSWPWDNSRGYQWFVDAAEHGHADAQYMVGMGKILGRGTRDDRPGAIVYFKRAAGQGQARAQYQLGKAYLSGEGVKKDLSWGRQWLEQAAWQEHSEAQFLLGALFAKGVGGQANMVEAWRWLQLAKRNGQRQAEQALETLAKKMLLKEKKAGDRLLAQQEKPSAFGLNTTPQVRYVQSVLNQLGFSSGDEDGRDGPATRSAVIRYTLKNNLPRDTQTIQLVESLRGKNNR